VEEQIFDRLCLDAWRTEQSQDRARATAKLVSNLASLGLGSHVVDFGCGTGRIATELALSGVRVVGIDRSRAAIAEAKHDAHPLCTFLEADWRHFSAADEFDCALFWGTTLCSGDESDLESLRTARRCLNETGVLIVETRHWDRMVRRFEARSERRSQDCVLVEDHVYDPVTGVQSTEECYSLGQREVQRRYQTRRYSFAELRGMCLRAGFATVEGYDETGARLSNESERAVLLARSAGAPQ
jgi:SAM-dependent methyltransferase